jgi:hypothetical protein
MALRIALVCACLGILADAARAQTGQTTDTPTAPAATRSDLEGFAMRIEAKLDQIQKNYGARLTALEEKVQALSDAQESGQQALQQIARLDKDGKSYLRIDASHEPTRTELRDAIIEASPKTGTVIIHNKTNVTQSVAVNDMTFDVLANSKREVSVPYRNFEVRTSNNRSLKWNFNYPKAESVVDIIDTTTTPSAADSTYASR